MPYSKQLIVTLMLFLAGGCALQPREPAAPAPAPVPAAPTDESAPVATDELSGPMLFDILLGELAGQRQQLDVSVRHYLRAAELSRDPRVAERAMRIALFSKDEDSALTAARRWVELAPTDLDARQSLAALALRAGIRDEAQEHMEYLVSRAGDSDEVFNTVTIMLARDEDRQAALEFMQKLVATHGDSAAAQLALSRIALHAGDFQLALDAVQKALELDPGVVPALIQRAKARFKLEQSDLALEELKQAVKRYPNEQQLRMVYAGLLLEQRQVPEARKQFRRLVKQNPVNADALYSLGLLAIDAGDFAEAHDHFTQLLALGKREQEAYYYLGRLEEEDGDFESAIEWYDRLSEGQYVLDGQMRSARLRAEQGDISGAQRLIQSMRLHNPGLALRLYLLEGDLLTGAGRYDEALQLYNNVLTEMPDNLDLLYARALLEARMGRLEQSERDLRRVIELKPDHAHALNALGYSLADNNERLDEALALIEQAYALAPDEAAIIDSLGWVHYRLGNLARAEEYLRQAWEKIKDSEVAAHLGEVLWQAGNKAEARRIWQEGQELNADNSVLQETLERFNP